MDLNDLDYDPSSWKRVFNWKWYKHQMTGWTTASYILLFVGYVLLLFFGFFKGFSWLAFTSTIAGMIGFTCVIAINNQRPINGVLGFVSALLLCYVALKTQNYSDITMQTVYIICLDIPVLMSPRWQKNGFKPRLLKGKYFWQTVAIFLGMWAATLILDTQLQHSPQWFLDSFAAAVGLTGAILAVRGFRAQYYFWTLQGMLSVALWIQTALNGHPVWSLMVTYILYLCNDGLSFFDKKNTWFHYDKLNNSSKD